MQRNLATRWRMGALALAGAAALTFGPLAYTAAGDARVVEDGVAGFVVTYFEPALANADASATGACPQGLTRSYRDIYRESPAGQIQAGETQVTHAQRVQREARQLGKYADGSLICMNPAAGGADPYHRNVVGRNIAVQGIDLDGQDGRANGPAAAGACAHDDFRGVDGARGVDAQLFRAMGCMRQMQPSEHVEGLTAEMMQGSWGILLRVSGIDDLRNDNEVEVSIFSNADPIQFGAGRQPLQNATYASVQDPRYRATTTGRIVNGVLTTEPVDVRLRYVIVSLRMDRVLNHARLRLSLSPSGVFEGILAGYAPVENAFDTDFGFRSAVDANGQPNQFRFQVAGGNPDTTGFTCQGIYRALHELADGDRDPETGRCTSISSQWRIRGMAAFVVDAETRSVNDPL